MNKINSNEKGLPLRYLLQVVFKHKTMMSILFLSIVLTVLIGNLLMKPVYQASAKILLELRENDEKALLFRMNLNPDYGRYNWINSEVEIIRSRPVVIRVIQDLDLLKNYRRSHAKQESDSLLMEEAIRDFYYSLSLETTKDAPMVQIQFNDKNPQQAARIVKSIIDNYISYRHQLFEKSASYKFLDEQTALTGQQLRELEAKAAEFKQQSGLAIPEEHGRILYEKLAEYEKNLAEVRSELAAKESRLQLLKQQLAQGKESSLPETGKEEASGRAAYLDELKSKLFDLEMKRQVLLEKFTPEYPEVANLSSQIETIHKKIYDEINQYIMEKETEAQAMRRQAAVLMQNINETRQEIKNFVGQEHQLEQLTRGIGDKRDVYSVLLRQKEEARLSMAKSQDRVLVKVVSPPSVPVDAVSPKRQQNVLLSVLVGLMVALAAAFGAEFLSHTYSSVEDVENHLGVPVLGSVSDFSHFDSEAKHKPAG